MVRLLLHLTGDARAPSGQRQEDLSGLASLCDLLESLDRLLVLGLGHALGQGVAVFEELEAAAAADGGERLVAAAEAIPVLFSEYYTKLGDGACLDSDAEGRP
jgi:hypothetical protein